MTLHGLHRPSIWRSTPFSNLNLDPSPPSHCFSTSSLAFLPSSFLPTGSLHLLFSLCGTLLLQIFNIWLALPEVPCPSYSLTLSQAFITTWNHLILLDFIFLALPSLSCMKSKTLLSVQWRAMPRQEVLNKYSLNVNDIIHFQFMIFLKTPKAQTLIKAQISVQRKINTFYN